MGLKFFTLDKLGSYPLVDGVVARPLKVNRDERGTLTEILKTDWSDVYSEGKLPFAQMYFSQTSSGIARDEDKWHYHPGGQQDRFGIIKGDIVAAVYDNRKDSPTYELLNLFHMGESFGDTGQYLLLLPEKVLHGFMVVSRKPAILVNFPNKLYDPKEEDRIFFKDVIFKDGSVFNWDLIRKKFSL